MEKLIKISQRECLLVAGGRSEALAMFVEHVAQCVGTFARLIYLASRKSRYSLVMQAENGEFPKW